MSALLPALAHKMGEQLSANAAAAQQTPDDQHAHEPAVFVAFVAAKAADATLAALREVDGCERAAAIGEVKTEPPGMVLVNTAFGGRRVMDQLVGDPLPRIC